MYINRSKFSDWRINLDGLSPEALEKVAKVLKVFTVRIETNPHSPGIKLPLRLFEGLDYVEVVDILKLLANNDSLFLVLNEYLKKINREIDVEIRTGRDFTVKNNLLKDVYYRLGFVEEDMQENILLEVKDPLLTNKLMRFQKQIEGRVEKPKNHEPLVNSTFPDGLLEYKSDGDTKYTSPSGKKYRAKFGKGTNPNLLLLYVTQDLHKQSYQFDEFEKVLRKPRSGGEHSGIENRVRNTVQTIREKMDLPDHEMIDIDYGVMLKCDVQVKR